MTTFAKEKKIQKVLYSRLTVVLLVIVVFFLGFSVYSVFEKKQQAESQASIAEKETKALLSRKVKTETAIENLQTDEGIEEILRNKYRAAKEGEGLVVVVDRTPENNQAEIDDKKISIFERISRFFGK